ncbi:MAG: acyl-CoA thioesterase [Bradymonadaceae bacterium]
MAELEDYPIVVEQSVSWGQMDAFGHVNNVQFFRFFEDARIAYFEALGIYDSDAPDSDEGGVGPILAETSCKFLAPLTYPDDLRIGARTTELGESHFEIVYEIASESLDRPAARGDSVVVSYDYDRGEKVPVPAAWREAFVDLEGDAITTR